jgi:hypothetical protein
MPPPDTARIVSELFCSVVTTDNCKCGKYGEKGEKQEL